MAREQRASKQVHEFYRVMAMIDGGATDEELAEAAALLAQAPGDKQGRLL